MVLPAGFERKDDKKFEEVSIPASSSAPVDIGRNLVAINSLDEVGMAAFQGIKTLNRIQSVVCDCAYRWVKLRRDFELCRQCRLMICRCCPSWGFNGSER